MYTGRRAEAPGGRLTLQSDTFYYTIMFCTMHCCTTL